MFNGRYAHKSDGWRIDLRVEFDPTAQVLSDISGDIFKKGPRGIEHYFSSFSMRRRWVPVQVIDGVIQLQFTNRIFRTRGSANPGTPETVEVLLNAQLAGSPVFAEVRFHFKQPQADISILNPFICVKTGNHFRHLELHLYHDDLNFHLPFPPLAHTPAQIVKTQGVDALKAIYAREQIHIEYANGGPVLLDGHTPENGWRRRDLHDLMLQSGFDPIPTDPVWKIWAFVTDRFDLSDGAFISLAGYSFDDIGERRRQGIAVFMNDTRFQGLETPTSSPHFAQASNAYLFTLAHELAHGLGLSHTRAYLDDPGSGVEPPDMMNEDFSIARGPSGDWSQFNWGFLPEEGHLLRHASWVDAAPGSFGATFGSGRRLGLTPTPGLELRVRSQKIFLCAEPVEIEVRLRCKPESGPFTVFPAFAPEAGLVSYQIRSAQAQNWQTLEPWSRLHGTPTARQIGCAQGGTADGSDRVSGLVPLYCGLNSMPIFEAGTYHIRAVYRDSLGQQACSNVHTIRITGSDYEWMNSIRNASALFQKSLLEFYYLNGSTEERFGPVRTFLFRLLRHIKMAVQKKITALEKSYLLRLRAKTERLLGTALSADQWIIHSEPTTGKLALRQQSPSAERLTRATRQMDRCVRYFRQKTRSKRQNFAYRRATEELVNLLTKTRQTDQIPAIQQRLAKDLQNRGVAPTVLDDMNANQCQLASV